jgi:hypothetical protein
MVAEIYDKTAQVRKQGLSWLPDLWGEGYDPSLAVWRVEFQFRREALADFQTRTVDEGIGVVRLAGIEPATSCSAGMRSIR